MKRVNTLLAIFNHDYLSDLTNVTNEKGFEYARQELSALYPELAALNVDSDEDWIKQAAKLLNVNYDDLVYELEKQVLRIYIMHKTYYELVDMLNDPNIRMEEKEKLVKLPLGKILFERKCKILKYGLKRAFKFSLLIGTLSFIPASVGWFLIPAIVEMVVPPIVGSLIFVTFTYIFFFFFHKKEHFTFWDKALYEALKE